MWKLVFELKNNEGQVVNTTILYVSERAFIGQSIFAAQTANDFITAEEGIQAELAESYMPQLIAYLNYHTFTERSTTASNATAVFFIDSLIIDNAENLSFLISYYNATTKERKMMAICLRDFHKKLGSYHSEAFEKIGKPVRMKTEETRAALGHHIGLDEQQNNQWLNFLNLQRDHFLPKQPIEYLPITDFFDFESHKDIGDYVKNNLIIALYNAASDYYAEIWEETIEQYKPNDFTAKRNSFNDKFTGIAQIQENGKLTTVAETFSNLMHHTLAHHQKNMSIEYLVDELLKRCAKHDAWLQDGGRAYFAALKHLKHMQETLWQGRFEQITKPDYGFFKIIALEKLPTAIRYTAVVGYKDTVEPLFKGIGVIGDRSRFEFTSFAKKIARNERDDSVVVKETDPERLRQLASVGAEDGSDQDSFEPASPSTPKPSFNARRDECRRTNPPPPSKNSARFTKANFKKFMDKIYKFMASDTFTRIMIGIGIGAGIAIIAGVFVTITFFSGGTFIPVAAAAAAVATMSGAGGIIGTMIAGLVVFSGLGGLFGWLVDKKIEKNKINKNAAENTGNDNQSTNYSRIGACNYADVSSRLGGDTSYGGNFNPNDGIMADQTSSSINAINNEDDRILVTENYADAEHNKAKDNKIQLK